MEQSGPGWTLRGLANVLTFVAACVLLFRLAEGLRERWEFPLLSTDDPVRVLFLLTEHGRRLAAGHAGVSSLQTARAKGFLPDDDWAELIEEMGHTAWRLPASRSMEDVQRLGEQAAMATHVVSAGWGKDAALQRVRATVASEAPSYLRRRIEEIQQGEIEPERARTEAAQMYDRSLRGLTFTLWGAGVVSLVVLLFGKRWYELPRPPASNPVSLGTGLTAFVWALVAFEIFPAVELGLPSALPAVVVGWWFLRRAPGMDGPAPLRRLLALPLGRRQVLGVVLVAVLIVAADSWMNQLFTVLAWLLRFPGTSIEGERGGPLYGDTATVVASLVSAVVLAPLGEELVFRGALFGGLATRFRVHTAATVSALLFALVHGYGLVASCVVFALGYALALVYSRTGSLVPGVIAHSVINAVIVLHDLAIRVTTA